ncbi:hypothetical protein DY218_06365 [Streptomyces triticagri]|uniref:Uncharacterized protein n=1 Tax=Streptomyces triticagri TaxID=2293568 RepID=A0A372M9J0_9ACTN|nr:DUF6099 family protein [Streptomyces triticagri]RFU87602.1 hypothetical protein DY218_06365 [Streptomyces triticagri]
MDAVRLIRECRSALASCQEVPAIMSEAWQAQALAQAIGGRLAVGGPPELRGDALGLSEVSGRGCGTLDVRPPGGGAIRAARLDEVADIREALTGLGSLLGEVGIALVGVACSADADQYYWQCIESIDAADESRDRVLEMLRRLTAREQGLAPDPLAGPP